MVLSMADQLAILLQRKVRPQSVIDLERALTAQTLNRHDLWRVCKRHAIFVPLCGTREFDVLVAALRRLFDQHSKQALKRCLAYVGDRCNTAGHTKVTRGAQRSRDPFAARPNGAARGAGPNRAVRRANRMIKV